jgi:serine/threonine-protein kinase
MSLFDTKKYIGKKFGGYTIEKTLGEGRYGMCFLARSDEGDRVVLKKFKSRIHAKNADRNAHEAVMLSRLRDERIPELLGVINEGGFYAFVIEWKPGATLSDLLFKQKHRFTEQEICSIGTKLIGIIKHLHENGIVHRDIRIPNVLMEGDRVYLVDFGLARFADSDRYRYDLDYSYLGDLLLYLVYSSFEKQGSKKLPWYEELEMREGQKTFLKRLLGIEKVYQGIDEIERDFEDAFCSKR